MSEFLKKLDQYLHLRREIERIGENKYLGRITIKFDNPAIVIPEGVRIRSTFVTTSHLTIASARISVSRVYFDSIEIRLRPLESRNWCREDNRRDILRFDHVLDKEFEIGLLDLPARIMILSEIKRILES